MSSCDDSTPEVSPIRSPGRDLDDTELEDGEISDESENFSEISDGELETSGTWRQLEHASPDNLPISPSSVDKLIDPKLKVDPVLPQHVLTSTSSRPQSGMSLPDPHAVASPAAQSGDDTGAPTLLDPGEEHNTESPASPLSVDVVTGSPVKMIPVSAASPLLTDREDSANDNDSLVSAAENDYISEDKTEDNDEEDDDENDEEIDEDILYLRLIALKSMAEEGEESSSNIKEGDQMQLEMQQLLQEAEKAAEEAGEEEIEKAELIGDESAVDNEEIFVIEEVLAKDRRTHDVIDLVSPVHSPTNSSSDRFNFDIDVNSPENIPLPGLPPLPSNQTLPPQPPGEPPMEIPSEPPVDVVPGPPPPQESLPPPPGPPPQENLPPPPLPPVPPPPPPPVISTTQSFFHVPSETTQSFLGNLSVSQFPPDLTGFNYDMSRVNNFMVPMGQHQSSHDGPVDKPEYSAVAQFLEFSQSQYGYQFGWRNQQQEGSGQHQFENDDGSSYAQQKSYDDYAPSLIFRSNEKFSPPKSPTKRNRKRKASKSRKRRKTSGETHMSEEDEASLRAMLLSQVMKNKEEKPTTTTTTTPLATVPQKQKKPVTSLADKQKKLIVIRKSSNKSVETNASKVKSKLNTTKQITQIGSKSTATKKLSKAAMLEHFPNMARKTIIPLNDTDSDSEDSTIMVKKKSEANNSSFQTNLDQFLKGMRQSKVSKTAPALKLNIDSETRKKLSLKLKAKANKCIESDAKTASASNISSLPLSKQREYLRLKQLIAKKEATKRKKEMEKENTGIDASKRPKLVNSNNEISDSKKKQLNKIASSKSLPKKLSKTVKVDGKVDEGKNMNTRNKPVVVKQSELKKSESAKKILKSKVLKSDKETVVVKQSEQKEDDEDENMLRQLLLKDLEEKTKSSNMLSLNKPLTINLQGDQRQVRVRKFNLTPYYKGKPKDNEAKGLSESSKVKESNSDKSKTSDSDASKEITISDDGQGKSISSGQSQSFGKSTAASRSEEEVIVCSDVANKSSSSPGRKVGSPQPSQSRSTSRPTTPSSPRPTPRSLGSSPKRKENDNYSHKGGTLSVTISNTTASSKQKVANEGESGPDKIPPDSVNKNVEQDVKKSGKNVTGSSRDQTSDSKTKCETKVLNSSVKKSNKQSSNKQIDSRKSTLANDELPETVSQERTRKSVQNAKRVGNTKVAPTSNKSAAKVAGPVKQNATLNKGTSETQKDAAKKKAETKPPTTNDISKMGGKLAGRSDSPKPLETASKKMIDELKKEEGNVVQKRGNLTTALFRLSAQISQLEKWTCDRDSAVKLRTKLQQELNQVDKLVKQREAGIDNTRIEIKSSHAKVTELREEMENSEARCEALGGQVYGAGAYQLSQKGAAEYRKKLNQIKNSAFKLNTGFKACDPKSKDSGNPSSKSSSGQSDRQSTCASAVQAGQLVNTTDQPRQPAPGSSSLTGNLESVSTSGGGNSAGSVHTPSTTMSKADSGVAAPPSSTAVAAAQLKDYVSPLDHVRSSTSPGLVLDPDKMLCRFELGGKCMDPSCPYQHCNK